MPGRLLADVDQLLLDIVSAATDLAEGHYGEKLPSDYVERLPFVHAYRWGGAAVNGRFLDEAVVDLHVYDTDKTNALDIAETCRTAFLEAWEQQTVFPNGSISSFQEQAGPSDLPSPTQPDRVTRIQATYRLWVCPPAVITT